MIVLDVVCRARVHDSENARALGCACPVAWGVPYRPAPKPKARPQRHYVRGRVENRRGPHLRTVTEPDWAAVERWIGGDRSLTLAAVERLEAIDQLTRRGLSASQIAIRLGVTERTVTRHRARRRMGVASRSLRSRKTVSPLRLSTWSGTSETTWPKPTERRRSGEKAEARNQDRGRQELQHRLDR